MGKLPDFQISFKFEVFQTNFWQFLPHWKQGGPAAGLILLGYNPQCKHLQCYREKQLWPPQRRARTRTGFMSQNWLFSTRLLQSFLLHLTCTEQQRSGHRPNGVPLQCSQMITNWKSSLWTKILVTNHRPWSQTKNSHCKLKILITK